MRSLQITSPSQAHLTAEIMKEHDHMYSTRHYFSLRMVTRQTATGSPPSGIG